MQVSDVKVRLVGRPGQKLRAFCSVAIDDVLVIRDFKVFEDSDGPFLAMPSRLRFERCPACAAKVAADAAYCSHCGKKLDLSNAVDDETPRHVEIVYPTRRTMRRHLEDRILEAYRAEVRRAEGRDFVESDRDSGPAGETRSGERGR